MKRVSAGTAAVLVSLLWVRAATAAVQAAPLPARKLELHGRVLNTEGKPIHGRRVATVVIHAAASSFSNSTQVLGSNFKFKGLEPGTYTVATVVRGLGEGRQSVEVSPSLADKKGRVRVELRLTVPDARKGAGHTVSVRLLSIPQRAWGKYQRALGELKKRHADRAVELLTEISEETPQFLEALNLLGTIYYHKRDLGHAEEYFRLALKQDPEAYEPTVNLGGTVLNQNRLQEALSLNQKAVSMRPADPLAQAQLGFTYFALGRPADAILHLTEAKRLDPLHFSHPQMTLAEIYMRQGQAKAAAAELEEFVRLHPDHPNSQRIRQELPRLRSRQ